MSSSLAVYEMLHSPYCIPVTRALECFGVPYQSIVVPNWDRRELARLTGGRYYQVPVVVAGEEVIFETADDPLAVPRYLDRNYFGGALFPEEWSGVQEVLVEHIENKLESHGFKLCEIHYLDAIADLGERTMVLRHKERAFGRGCLAKWKAEAGELAAQFEGLLTPFDRRLQHAPFLLGDSPRYADFALFGVLGNYIYAGYNELPRQLSALSSWHRRLASYRTVPENGQLS